MVRIVRVELESNQHDTMTDFLKFMSWASFSWKLYTPVLVRIGPRLSARVPRIELILSPREMALLRHTN